jgi:uncharacterized RDD family membrane protein YckC
MRRRERTWKDEVRERVRDRKREKSGEAELPLFREEGPLDDLISPDPSPSAAAPPEAAEGGGIRELGDEASTVVEADDLPLRPREEVDELPAGLTARSASRREPVFEEAPVAERRVSLEPPVAERRVSLEPPVAERHVSLEPPEPVERRPPVSPGPSPHGRILLDDDFEEEADASASWTLDAPVRTSTVTPVERPAGWFERLQAAFVDLALLAGLWALVVYFASRAAHVPISGLLPSWPYLGGYLAFLGLTYAAYFTGATGQTLGKIVSGLRVVDTAGQPPGYLRAFVRAALGALGIALFFGGLLPMFLDPARRAAHDRLLRTRVVKG